MKNNRILINTTVYLLALSIFFGLGSPFAMALPSVPEAKPTTQDSKAAVQKAGTEASRIDTASDKVQLPAGVSKSWWASAQENIKASEYQVRWQEKTPLKGLASAYQAPNRANNFRTYYTPEGIRVVPRTETSPSWEWGLRLKRAGSAGAMQAVEAAKLKHSGNRMEYRRGPITEWYVNDKKGLEQGFTLASAPSEKSTDLVLEMEITGNVSATLQKNQLSFTSPAGVRVVTYNKLHVVDANGRELPAQFALLEKKLSILVDSENAVYPVTIDPLASSTTDWSVTGTGNSEFGFSVATAGDVDGDLISDVVVGAPSFDDGSVNQGKVFVYLGASTGLSTTAAWTEIGRQAGDQFGYSVATAGDVNGDGISDVIIGAPTFDRPLADPPGADSGRAYIFYGHQSAGLAHPANFSDWFVTGVGGEQFGFSVSTAGDMDGDGKSDVIVGAPEFDGAQGRAFIFSGQNLPFSNMTTSIAENDVLLTQSSGRFGHSVATAGDVNGDGKSDVVIGGPNTSVTINAVTTQNVGRAYIYRGGSNPGGITASLTGNISGETGGDLFGWSVATAGDVDGDGTSDVIIGAKGFDTGNNAVYNEGRAYVFHGSAFPVTNGTAGAADWIATGDVGGGEFGTSVASAGDVNGDGLADVVVGAPAYSPESGVPGKAYVFHGSKWGLSLGDPSVYSSAADTTLSGPPTSEFGVSVAPAGDVNGDGFADVLVGASMFDAFGTAVQQREGRAFVYYGGPSGLSQYEDWHAVGEMSRDHFGFSVASAGDVNGDSHGDVVVGAKDYDERGAAFVFPGSRDFGNQAGLVAVPGQILLGNSDLSIAGRFGFSVASAGDVNGDGFSDIVVGAPSDGSGVFPREGRSYVFSGGSNFFGGDRHISPSPMWVGRGGQSGAQFGISVSTAGDVNGDGFGDVIVGANRFTGQQSPDVQEGAAFVFHGSPNGLTQCVTGPLCADWSAESNQNRSEFGFSVSTAGDVNADGYTDVIVGAYRYNMDSPNEGRVYVFLGGQTPGRGLETDASWTVESGEPDSSFGVSVSTAGDVNGDGYADVIVGASTFGRDLQANTPEAGRAFVYHGGPPSGLNTSGLSPVADWFAIGDQAGAQFGNAVSLAGDVNGDGYADVVIGAWHYDVLNGVLLPNAGMAYAFYGSSRGLSPDAVNPRMGVESATADWTVAGAQANAEFGISVSSAGDVNGDAYADVIVGEDMHSYDSLIENGRATLYFGNSSDGLPVLPKQMHPASSHLISPLGQSNVRNSFKIGSQVVRPFGQTDAKMEWEVLPLVPGRTFASPGGVPLRGGSTAFSRGSNPTQTITGLSPGTHYRWRGRFLYDPASSPFQQASRWFNVPWNGANEEDLKTMTNQAPTARPDIVNIPENTGENIFYNIDVQVLSPGFPTHGPGVVTVQAGSDRDPEGDGLTLTVSGTPLHGRARVSTFAGNRVIQYRPDQFNNMEDTFDYQVSDPFGSTATATLTIRIIPNNNGPTANNDPVVVNEDDTLIIPVGTRGIPGSGLLANDTDPDPADILTLISPSGFINTLHGTLTPNRNLLSAITSFTYKPNLDYNGPDSFLYSITDGSLLPPSTATVLITVNPVNDAPIAIGGVYGTQENTVLDIPTSDFALANSDSRDFPPLRASVHVLNVHSAVNGTVQLDAAGIHFTPGLNFSGGASFKYTLEENSGAPRLTSNSPTVSVNVGAVNSIPIPENPVPLRSTPEDTDLTVDVIAGATNPDGPKTDLQVIIPFGGASSGSAVVNNGSFFGRPLNTITFTPAPDASGDVIIQYELRNVMTGLRASASLNIEVTPVNDPPVANPDFKGILEDAAPVFINILGNDTDKEDGPGQSSFTGLVGVPTLGSAEFVGIGHADFSFHPNTVKYTPNLNASGMDMFGYSISDSGAATAQGTIEVTITPVNDLPLAVDDSASTAFNTAVTIDVLSNDSDLDGDELSITRFGQGAKGSVSRNTAGDLVYTPDTNTFGSDSFTYTISDGKGGTAVGTVNVDVAVAVTTQTLVPVLPLPDGTMSQGGSFVFPCPPGFTCELGLKEKGSTGDFDWRDVSTKPTFAKAGQDLLYMSMGFSGVWYLWMSLIAGAVIGFRKRRFMMTLLVVGCLAFTGCSSSSDSAPAATGGASSGNPATISTTDPRLQAGKTYEWKVRATNGSGVVIESTVRTVTVTP